VNKSFYDQPWPHATIDDLIDSKTIQWIQQKTINDDNQGHYYADHYIWDGNGLTIENTGKDIIANLDDWFTMFPSHNKFEEYEMLTYVSKQSAGHRYPIHDEHPYKCLSFVTYVYPEQGCGTSLYQTENDQTAFDTIPWQVGRTFVFAGQTGKTWHSYESGPNTRITLNHFVIKKGELMSFKH